jgi:hypothetical protein
MNKEIKWGLSIAAIIIFAALTCMAQQLETTEGAFPSSYSGDQIGLNYPSDEPWQGSSYDPQYKDYDSKCGDCKPKCGECESKCRDCEECKSKCDGCDSSCKLKCYIKTDKSVYRYCDLIDICIEVSEPCYTKIIITKPDNTKSIIGPTWRSAPGIYCIKANAGKQFGTRKVSLKAWTKAYPQKVCNSYTTYIVGQIYGYGTPVSGYADFPGQLEPNGFENTDVSSEFEGYAQSGDFDEPADQ